MQSLSTKRGVDVKHVVSLEKLFHFRCYSCDQWWSIGDWQEKKEIACPHCGVVAEIEKNEETKCEELNFISSGKTLATFGARGSWDPFHRRHDWSIDDGGYICRDCGKWSAEKDYSVCNKGENHIINGSLDTKG